MILKLFLFWRLGLFLIAAAGFFVFTVVPNGSPGSPFSGNVDYWLSWAQWDGGHYLNIVNRGYEDIRNVAFMPLFPALTKFISGIFGPLFSGLVVSNISFLLFLFVVNKYITSVFSKEIAKTTILVYLFFPSAFFAVSYYSEGLYLLLSSLTLLFYYQKRTVPMLLSLFLSITTRFVGVALFAGLFTSYLKSHLKSKRGFPWEMPFVIVFPIAAFATIASLLIFPYGRNMGMLLSVQSFWGREAIDPISSILGYVFPILFFENRPFMDYIDLFFTVAPLAFLIIYARRLSIVLWVYSMLAILIPISTGTLSGMPRYLLASFGFFIVLAQFLNERPRMKVIYFTASLALQVFFLVRFFNGFWVS